MPAIATPFDCVRLDRLMDEAGIDVLLATSKHNVQYLLGGHRAFFFDYMDAMGLSRYLPVMVYPKGRPDKAAYFGHRLENFQQQVKPLWTPEVQANSSGALDTIQKAADYLKTKGVDIVWGPRVRETCSRAEICDPNGYHIELRQWFQ